MVFYIAYYKYIVMDSIKKVKLYKNVERIGGNGYN